MFTQVRPKGTASCCWCLGLTTQIVGSVYVYGTNPQFEDNLADDYCDFTSFVIALVMVSALWGAYLMAAAAAIVKLCVSKRFCCNSANSKKSPNSSDQITILL